MKQHKTERCPASGHDGNEIMITCSKVIMEGPVTVRIVTRDVKSGCEAVQYKPPCKHCPRKHGQNG